MNRQATHDWQFLWVGKLRIVPLLIISICAIWQSGCQSPPIKVDAYAEITDSLEKQITEAEAREILLPGLDQMIAEAQSQAATNSSSPDDLKVLSGIRAKQLAKFEKFKSCARPGDELWTYRTYITSDRRGGESGFAWVRNGRAVENMVVLVYD